MRDLVDARQKFETALANLVPHSVERGRLLGVVDQIVGWSQKQGGKLVFNNEDYDQDVISFAISSSPRVFWSVFPVKRDGSAKLELVPRTAEKLSGDLHQLTVNLLNSLSREQISVAGVLKIDLRALKSSGSRDKLFLQMDALLADCT